METKKPCCHINLSVNLKGMIEVKRSKTNQVIANNCSKLNHKQRVKSVEKNFIVRRTSEDFIWVEVKIRGG